LAAPLELSVRPFGHFWLTGSDDTDAPLQFLGGLDISSPDRDFGGYSGVAVTAGSGLLLIGDSGSLVRARLVHEGGRLAGMADAEIDSLFPEGDGSKQASDAEDVALDPENPQRGVIVRERQANALLTFELQEGKPTGFKPMRVGADDRILRSNKGLESVAYAPATSPAAGKIVAIAERAPRGEENIPGWIAGVGPFEIMPHDDFDVSSARFLPDGDLVLLERRYTPGWGIAMRLRRIDGAALKVGAKLDGHYLIDAGMTSQIDNMEGLAVHQDGAGRTILTLVSDDNHSILQRTLLLQFALSGE
jgi:hypothetical protein